jgi:hypothetical protein
MPQPGPELPVFIALLVNGMEIVSRDAFEHLRYPSDGYLGVPVCDVAGIEPGLECFEHFIACIARLTGLGTPLLNYCERAG